MFHLLLFAHPSQAPGLLIEWTQLSFSFYSYSPQLPQVSHLKPWGSTKLPLQGQHAPGWRHTSAQSPHVWPVALPCGGVCSQQSTPWAPLGASGQLWTSQESIQPRRKLTASTGPWQMLTLGYIFCKDTNTKCIIIYLSVFADEAISQGGICPS